MPLKFRHLEIHKRNDLSEAFLLEGVFKKIPCRENIGHFWCFTTNVFSVFLSATGIVFVSDFQKSKKTSFFLKKNRKNIEGISKEKNMCCFF